MNFMTWFFGESPKEVEIKSVKSWQDLAQLQVGDCYSNGEVAKVMLDELISLRARVEVLEKKSNEQP